MAEAFITAELIRRASERLDGLTDPFFSGLDLKPDDDWSPRTKLDFYAQQASLAERIMDRVEGTPVARTKAMTDRSGAASEVRLEDVPPRVAAELLAAVLEAAGESPSDLVERAAERERTRRADAMRRAHDAGWDVARMQDMATEDVEELLR